MKTKKLLLVLAVSTLIFSCGKDDDPPAPVTPTPTTPAATVSAQPTLPGQDGALWAVKSVTSVSGIPFTIGIGVAFFDDGTGSFVDVGTVKLNTKTVAKNANNSYTFVPGLTTPTGISFSSGVNWDVTGGNGYPAITKAVTFPFPSASAITSSATVTKANGYTLTVSSVSDADSVLFLVGGASKTISGNATTCTFSASELSSLTTGSAAVQVAAYATESETLSGKLIYYGKETVQSLTVTIQ